MKLNTERVGGLQRQLRRLSYTRLVPRVTFSKISGVLVSKQINPVQEDIVNMY
jgi:hypothetical protein